MKLSDVPMAELLSLYEGTVVSRGPHSDGAKALRLEILSRPGKPDPPGPPSLSPQEIYDRTYKSETERLDRFKK